MKKLAYILLLLAILCACKLPQFSFKPGGKSNGDIPGNTVQVNFFENRSALSNSAASITLTEGVKDIVLAQSKKELVSEKGDWIVDGTITQYSVAPIAIQAGSETAAQSRLTMTVKIGAVLKVDKVENNILVQQDSLVIDPTASEGIITAFVDFDNSANFASIEDELLQELVRQLSQDIYDKVFGGKW